MEDVAKHLKTHFTLLDKQGCFLTWHAPWCFCEVASAGWRPTWLHELSPDGRHTYDYIALLGFELSLFDWKINARYQRDQKPNQM